MGKSFAGEKNGRKERKVIHVPIGTTQQMKMSCATFKSNDGKSPSGPLCQRGRAEGPGDFCL